MRIMKIEETLGTPATFPETAYPSGSPLSEYVREPSRVVTYQNMLSTNRHDPRLGRSQGSLNVSYPGNYITRRYAPVNEGGNLPLAWALANKVKRGEQIPLFTDEKESNFAPHISIFKGTMGGRVGNMTMLGVAELDAQRQGKTLADDYTNSSLSPHSSNLVEKLTGQKVPVTNNWDFQEIPNEVDLTWVDDYPDKKVSFVPDEDIKVGRGIIRSAIRNNTLSKQFDAHNYEQLQLPEV